MRAVQEEVNERLPPQVFYPLHMVLWNCFPKLHGVLLYPHIQRYVEAQMHLQGEGWTAEKVR